MGPDIRVQSNAHGIRRLKRHKRMLMSLMNKVVFCSIGCVVALGYMFIVGITNISSPDGLYSLPPPMSWWEVNQTSDLIQLVVSVLIMVFFGSKGGGAGQWIHKIGKWIGFRRRRASSGVSEPHVGDQGGRGGGRHTTCLGATVGGGRRSRPRGFAELASFRRVMSRKTSARSQQRQRPTTAARTERKGEIGTLVSRESHSVSEDNVESTFFLRRALRGGDWGVSSRLDTEEGARAFAGAGTELAYSRTRPISEATRGDSEERRNTPKVAGRTTLPDEEVEGTVTIHVTGSGNDLAAHSVLAPSGKADEEEDQQRGGGGGGQQRSWHLDSLSYDGLQPGALRSDHDVSRPRHNSFASSYSGGRCGVERLSVQRGISGTSIYSETNAGVVDQARAMDSACNKI